MSARSSWALGTLATTLREKLERDWQALPRAQRALWARDLLLGVVLAVVALAGGIALVYYTSGGTNRFEWETRALHAIEAGPIGFSTAVWLQTFGTDLMLLVVVLIATGFAIWKDRPLLAITIVLSVLLMDALVRVGWFAFERTRPNVIAQGVATPGFHSFPSGHTSKTLALYGLLIAQWIKASNNALEKSLAVIVAFIICVVVPFGRVRMGAHWPTDILGGWAIGGVWLACALFALRHENFDGYARER